MNPLASLTDLDKTLVFCPTSVWNVHHVPLHALELPVPSSSLLSTHSIPPSSTDEHPDEEPIGNILAVRNRIIYTCSQSLLHISFQACQSRAMIPSDDWRATVLSPLSQSLPAPHTLPLKGAFKPILTRTIDTNRRRFAAFIGSHVVRTAQISDRFAVQRIVNANFFYFLGHIHGPSGASTSAIAQHMMLHHPQVNPDCLPGAVHKSGSSLSAEAVPANCRMRQGSHAVLLGCGSGVPQHSAVDEPLGLVSALCSGASSMVSASWDILAEDACWWPRFYQEAWAREERRIRESGIQGPVIF